MKSQKQCRDEPFPGFEIIKNISGRLRAHQGGQGGLRNHRRWPDRGSRPGLRERRVQGSWKCFGKAWNRNYFSQWKKVNNGRPQVFSKWAKHGLFLFILVLFTMQIQMMVCLGLEPGMAGWKAQTNPLSYGGISTQTFPRNAVPAMKRAACYRHRN